MEIEDQAKQVCLRSTLCMIHSPSTLCHILQAIHLLDSATWLNHRQCITFLQALQFKGHRSHMLIQTQAYCAAGYVHLADRQWVACSSGLLSTNQLVLLTLEEVCTIRGTHGAGKTDWGS